MKTIGFLTAGLSAVAMAFSSGVMAEQQWWPFEITSVEGKGATSVEYAPLDKASKEWNLCALIPHMKDSYFMAVDYGLVQEAKRQGVKLTVLQADGYVNLPKQVSQFDDCLNSGADAILTAPISEAGLSRKLEEGMSKGIPQIVFINPVMDTDITSKVFVDYSKKGEMTGKYLIENSGNDLEILAFPGPQGSGWAESYLSGLERSLENTSSKILDTKFGDAGVPQQLRLIEDSLQTYPEANAIWGGAPAAEAAVGAVEELGMEDDISIMSSYENQTMLDLVNRKQIYGFATEYPVMQARMAVDLAIRALEGKDFSSHYEIIPKIVTPETISTIDISQVLAPKDWSPIYSVN